MRTIPTLVNMLNTMGWPVTYHRESGGTDCPCRTPEGFRDPSWHIANPGEPVCNEIGKIGYTVTEFIVQAAVQPVSPARGLIRLPERVEALLGEVQEDDHIGIFPVEWAGNTLDFSEWDTGGQNYILHDNRRYISISSDKIPDIDGDPNHHFEVGLRLVKNERPV